MGHVAIEERPLAKYVRRLRQGKYMSQADLGRAAGLSRNYVKWIEDGFIKDPSLRKVGLLLGALDSSVVEIMEAAGVLSPRSGESSIRTDVDFAEYLRRRRGLSHESVTTIVRLVELSALESELSPSRSRAAQ
jgi:transcriptional regulator with XRE-family HTH domain